MKIDDLILTKPLYRGEYRIIYLSTKQGSSVKYISIQINKKTLSEEKELKNIFDNYFYALNDTNHPNIVKLLDKKETSDDIYLVLEYCNGGNIEDFSEKYFKENEKPLTEEIVQYIMRQVINTLKYLHQKKIIFRNIKPSKLLINYENEEDIKNNNIMKGKIKIADFAFSSHLEKGEFSNLLDIIGNPIFIPPEIIFDKNDERKYNEKIDIWSLGITCYELLTRKIPFNYYSLKILFENVGKGDYYVPLIFSKETISFLNCMLQYDPNKRYSCEQLSKHSFLTKDVNEFHKVNINELKNIEIVYNNRIKINIKNNDYIFEAFGN